LVTRGKGPAELSAGQASLIGQGFCCKGDTLRGPFPARREEPLLLTVVLLKGATRTLCSAK